MAPLTTFKLGGPARYFVTVKTEEELRESLDFARDQNLSTLVLGGGSNILVNDAGFDGLVIHIDIRGVRREGDLLVAGAGEAWDTVVERAVAEGLWGLENLSGIPGSVGGAVVQGIGAYGAAIGQTLLWVDVLEPSGGTRRVSNTECEFEYRTSIFKRKDWVVLRAAFVLHRDGRPNTSYVDIAEAGELSLAEVRQKILGIRGRKFPDLSLEGTAGSFFKNPILPPSEAALLQKKYPAMPVFAMPETSGIKIPLAWLLDNVLGLKGFSVGGARLYEHQPLVIAATRTASAADVAALARIVKEKVKNSFDIVIEEEVRVL